MPQKDPKFEALEAVYAALKSLNQQERQEIVASAFALLGGSPPQVPSVQIPPSTAAPSSGEATGVPSRMRPKGLMELIQECHPGTNPQRIVVFAYWRERHEGAPRFGREDLKAYFVKAHITPPRNYDRDFNHAVQKGWLHEDSADSYITTKGIEVVETGFEGERSYSPRDKGAARKRGLRKRVRRTAKSESK